MNPNSHSLSGQGVKYNSDLVHQIDNRGLSNRQINCYIHLADFKLSLSRYTDCNTCFVIVLIACIMYSRVQNCRLSLS